MTIKAIDADSDILLLVVKVPVFVLKSDELSVAFSADLKAKIEAGGRKCPPIKLICEGMDIMPIRAYGETTCVAS